MVWLEELHSKLWGREDLLNQVFRSVDLTKKDFVELQSNLHGLNPSRNCKSYKSNKKNILDVKIDFLRSRTARPVTTTTDSPVSKVVFRDSIPAGAMDVDLGHEGANNDVGDDEAKGDEEDENSEGNDDEESEGEDDEDGDDEDGDGEDDEYSEGDDDNKSYIDEDAAVLSHGSTPVLPCTIRYMDLTCLNLQHFRRVSQVLLIRDEWDAVIDIFNQGNGGDEGIEGSAVWTGQPGTGKRHYSSWICDCN